MGSTNQVELSCQVCGKGFFVYPSRLAKGHVKYCSRACYTVASVGMAKPKTEGEATGERACAACGNVFAFGGRRGKLKTQRFCSDTCQRASRYRRGLEALSLIDVEAAYIAGLIDGEGSIMIVPHHKVYAIKMAVTNTDRPVLDWLKQKTGVGGLHSHRAQGERNRQTWIWACHGVGVETLLRQIQPYMRIKADQAGLAIAMQERLRVPALKADREWQVEWREKMQAMNKRGPREPDSD